MFFSFKAVGSAEGYALSLRDALPILLKAQVIGSLIITVATFAVAMAVMYLIKAVGLLRVSAEGEAYGLDLQIGRASCRERVEISVVAVVVKERTDIMCVAVE